MDSKEVKTKQNTINKPSNSKRRSLQLLQPMSNNNKLLTRDMSEKHAQLKNKATKNQTITKWLTEKDSIDNDVKYWKTLAKERAKALEKALKENEELVHQKDELIHQNEILTQENEHLSKLAEEGVKLKELIEEYL